MPVVSYISASGEAAPHCRSERTPPRFCESAVQRCSPFGMLGYGIIQRLCSSGKRLLYAVLLKQPCQRFWNILAASVAVEGQAWRASPLLESCLERCSDQMCTRMPGYPPASNFTRIQIKDNAEIDPIAFDLEVCYIANPYLLGKSCWKFSF